MMLVVGLGMAGAGALLFLAGLRVFRRPQPPRWLQQGLAGDLLTVAAIGLLTMGFGLIVKFFATLPERTFGLAEASGTAVVLAALLAVGWLFRMRRVAPAARSTATGATVVPLAVNDDPEPRPRGTPAGQPAGRGGRRKRAA